MINPTKVCSFPQGTPGNEILWIISFSAGSFSKEELDALILHPSSGRKGLLRGGFPNVESPSYLDTFWQELKIF